jgi:hypothetical protein
MKTLYRLTFLLAVGPLGCSGGGSHSSGLNITGAWHGAWALDNGDTGPLVMAPNQNGGSVQGFAEFGNSTCFFDGFLNGTVHGHTFTGAMTNGGVNIAFVVTISGPTDESMDGEIEVDLGGDCTGEAGTVSLVRDP